MLALAKTIDGDQLSLQFGERTVAPGKMIAMIFLLIWYLLWAWIPLAILAAGGRLLFWTIKLGDKPAAPPSPTPDSTGIVTASR